MKKTYRSPRIEVIRYETQRLLNAVSGGAVGSSPIIKGGAASEHGNPPADSKRYWQGGGGDE